MRETTFHCDGCGTEMRPDHNAVPGHCDIDPGSKECFERIGDQVGHGLSGMASSVIAKSLCRETTNTERKCVAISIKHTEHRWKFGMPCVLWGWKQTRDDEPRCFAGYTEYISKAERYAPGEFRGHGYGSEIMDKAPVQMTIDLCKKWRAYDTILVDAEQYYHYCKMAGLPTEPPKEETT